MLTQVQAAPGVGLDAFFKADGVAVASTRGSAVDTLRHKIEANPQAPELIVTVRGGGYVFACEVTPA